MPTLPLSPTYPRSKNPKPQSSEKRTSRARSIVCD
ncbi:hypothetical protein OOU_Y34scaffold00666g220 [Pyricularia oryzae Y34]|uniref:Uncharacterized protein n=3 Tax=Pyricularia oryzae TaxID=318829 RepID=Q2KGL7_PYRO7|nr:hypothetical protein MGCH7_ch7g318 [Pyricularia oryzae 70-15]ELQ36359.1 hypothetical protein OOU_Y34scaffold00666g220 [Pyricularia oryzae Y34]